VRFGSIELVVAQNFLMRTEETGSFLPVIWASSLGHLLLILHFQNRPYTLTSLTYTVLFVSQSASFLLRRNNRFDLILPIEPSRILSSTTAKRPNEQPRGRAIGVSIREGFAKPHKSSRSTGRWRGILNCDAIYRLLKDTDHDYV